MKIVEIKYTCNFHNIVSDCTGIPTSFLLRDKLVKNVVIHAAECFNLQCNSIARQVEEQMLPVLPDLKSGNFAAGAMPRYPKV